MNAPGPPGLPWVGNLFAFRRDVLQLLVDGRRRYGDVVRYRLGPRIVHLVCHPDHVRQVLVTQQHCYDKETPSSARIRGICGESLLTGNGDFWMRQRRLIQPVFQPQAMAAYHDEMVRATADLLGRWQTLAAAGRPIDVASEMMRLTFTIIGRALFGADVGGDVEAVERAATTVLAHTYRRLEHVVPLPLWLPTPGNIRFRRALAVLDRLVLRIVAEQQRAKDQQAGPAFDLVSRLSQLRDDATDAGMTNRQLRNETITLLLAGHETTANALTWTWHLLGKHPEAASRLRAELQEVLADRPPTFDELPKLRYTRQVIQEAMRLYPPIWIMERRVREDDEIGGFRIPAGTTVAVSPYVTHRHPDFWNEPERFDPERFTPEEVARRPPLAYFPFGAGGRLCIGNHFALMEAQIIVAMLGRHFRLDPVADVPIVPQPRITLRSKHGLPMTLHSLRSELS